MALKFPLLNLPLLESPAACLALAVVVGGAGLASGAGLAVWLSGRGESIGRTEHDGWLGNTAVGSTRADPWTRAVTARVGLMALDRRETVYFHRYRDEAGRPLDSRCLYELSGGELPARWWSVTLYAEDNYLAQNDDQAFSVDATHVVRDSAGRWTVRLAPERQDAPNWISSRGTGHFNLSIRLYNPGPAVAGDPAGVPFPEMRRLSCVGEG